MADIWAPLRAGSDILFLGGLRRPIVTEVHEQASPS
jgi:phosphoribulokinase